MEQLGIDQHLVRKYLLDELAEAERERLEERLLTDDSLYETLVALEDEVEDELIDQYLDGELTKPERENFERIFLNNPERAGKLKLIKDLKGLVAVPVIKGTPAGESAETAIKQPRRRSWIPSFAVFRNPLFGLSGAAALVLAVLSGGWLLMKANRLEAELRQARAREPLPPAADSALKEQLEQLRRRNEELAANLRRAEEQRTGLEQDLASLRGREGQYHAPPVRTTAPRLRNFVASVILSPARRGPSGEEQFPTLTLRPGVTQARLVLPVKKVDPGDYQSFRAAVKKRGGEEIWRSDTVKVRAKGNQGRAVLTLPAEGLTEGQYNAELDGVASDGSTTPLGLYSFRIVTKKP